MFPQGGPGVALLLLRIAVAATFLMSVANRFGMSSFHLLFAGALLISISLSIGFLTPFLSVIACAAAVAGLFGPPTYTHFIVPTILDAAALALLGPGAYSLDAHLFGRRVTVVTPRKNRDRV